MLSILFITKLKEKRFEHVRCAFIFTVIFFSSLLHCSQDNGISYATLVGCLIGAFFGTLLVAALFFVTLQRSESFRKCFSKPTKTSFRQCWKQNMGE